MNTSIGLGQPRQDIDSCVSTSDLVLLIPQIIRHVPTSMERPHYVPPFRQRRVHCYQALVLACEVSL